MTESIHLLSSYFETLKKSPFLSKNDMLTAARPPVCLQNMFTHAREIIPILHFLINQHF